jgi:hypothetical protein
MFFEAFQDLTSSFNTAVSEMFEVSAAALTAGLFFALDEYEEENRPAPRYFSPRRFL